MRGLEYPHQLEISVNGERVHLASFGGDKEIAASSDNPTITGDDVDGRFTVRVPLKAGPARIGVAFVEKTHALNTRRLQSYVRSSSDTIDFSGYPHIDEVILTGPFKATGVGDTPSRRRIFVCQPKAAADEEGCARTDSVRRWRGEPIEAMSRRRTCRRCRSSSSVAGATAGASMPGSISRSGACCRARSSSSASSAIPRSVPPAPPIDCPISKIASRLSFFLWSSIPDDTLLDVASKGGLKTPAGLEQQVRRMLADPKSQALVDNFVGQWLQLRNLKTKQPNSHEFPDFDDNLRTSLGTEAEMFFASIMREDRSVVDLMTADYTFVNERLARHYGIPNVYGTHFRRVTLQGRDPSRAARQGRRADGDVASASDVARPAREVDPRERPRSRRRRRRPTSCRRSKKMPGAAKPKSVRERMEQHRRNPACASCHRMIDPAGLALENFDAVGAWRTKDGGTRGAPVDASGQLVDGTQINGVVELRAALLREPETFVRTMTEKLMTVRDSAAV